MRRCAPLLLLPLLGLLARPACAQDKLWIDDFEAAKTQAKAESKLILADFTGSDWCGWCIKLKSEVFDQAAFKSDAPKRFVLLELDYPNEKQLPAKVKAQNEKLSAEYKIEGFPTILLLDAAGKVLARTGYREGGPAKYMEHLTSLVKAAEQVGTLRAEADKAKGVERAKVLDKLVVALDELGSDSAEAGKLAAEITTLDADGKAGLRAKYLFRTALDTARALLAEGKNAEAKAAFDKALALDGLTPEQKQQTMLEQGECLFGLKDMKGLVALLKKAIDVAPDSELVPQLKQMVERFGAEAGKE